MYMNIHEVCAHTNMQLLPMLKRFGAGRDPAILAGIKPGAKSVNDEMLRPFELDRYRQLYTDLARILDQQLAVTYMPMTDVHTCKHQQLDFQCSKCGTFGGSVTQLIEGLSHENNTNLVELLVAGNPLTDEMIGAVLHTVSKITRDTVVEVESVVFQPVSNTGTINALVRAKHGMSFPKSSVSADGYHVLAVQPAYLTLDCGMESGLDVLKLEHISKLVVSHSLETGLTANKMHTKPVSMAQLAAYRPDVHFVSPAQLSFEREIHGRIMHRKATSAAARQPQQPHQPLQLPQNPLQLCTMLQSWNAKLAALKSLNEEAFDKAGVGYSDKMSTAAAKRIALPRSKARHIGSRVGFPEAEMKRASSPSMPISSLLSGGI